MYEINYHIELILKKYRIPIEIPLWLCKLDVNDSSFFISKREVAINMEINKGIAYD
jgi:hypothetical protein